jgi:hypothetical protein
MLMLTAGAMFLMFLRGSGEQRRRRGVSRDDPTWSLALEFEARFRDALKPWARLVSNRDLSRVKWRS